MSAGEPGPHCLLCSKILSKDHFLEMWEVLSQMLKQGGILYAAMDSTMNTDIGEPAEHGMHQFPDSKVRFVLTSELYEEMKKGFEEIEPLRTLVHHKLRAQSFMALRKR